MPRIVMSSKLEVGTSVNVETEFDEAFELHVIGVSAIGDCAVQWDNYDEWKSGVVVVSGNDRGMLYPCLEDGQLFRCADGTEFISTPLEGVGAKWIENH